MNLFPTSGKAPDGVETGTLWQVQMSPCGWFNSRSSVNPSYWYLQIAVVLVFSFAPVAFPSAQHSSHYDFPALRDQDKLAIHMAMALCVPMLVDSLLDRSSARFRWGRESLRALLGLSIFIPLVLLVIYCVDLDHPNVPLYFSLLAVQQTTMNSLLYMLYNAHDREIWSDVRTTLCMSLHNLAWVSMVLGRVGVSGCDTFGRVVFLFDMGLFLYILLALWVPKYWGLMVVAIAGHTDAGVSSNRFGITKFIFGLENSVYTQLTADEAVSILYVLASALLNGAVLIASLHLVGLEWAAYAQAVFVVLLTVYPGRVARQQAIKSDVSSCLALSIFALSHRICGCPNAVTFTLL